MQKQYDIKPQQRDNYFVRTYPQSPEKIEMSFNLSTYQPHLRAAGLNVYQTYYLNGRCGTDRGTGRTVTPCHCPLNHARSL